MDEKLRKEYFEKAFKLHSAGNIVEAKNLYLKILGENSDDYEVLNLLGMIEFQQKNFSKAEEFVKKAVKEDVVLVPGAAFGEMGKNYIRLSYAQSYENLEVAMSRLEKIV